MATVARPAVGGAEDDEGHEAAHDEHARQHEGRARDPGRGQPARPDDDPEAVGQHQQPEHHQRGTGGAGRVPGDEAVEQLLRRRPAVGEPPDLGLGGRATAGPARRGRRRRRRAAPPATSGRGSPRAEPGGRGHVERVARVPVAGAAEAEPGAAPEQGQHGGHAGRVRLHAPAEHDRSAALPHAGSRSSRRCPARPGRRPYGARAGGPSARPRGSRRRGRRTRGRARTGRSAAAWGRRTAASALDGLASTQSSRGPAGPGAAEHVAVAPVGAHLGAAGRHDPRLPRFPWVGGARLGCTSGRRHHHTPKGGQNALGGGTLERTVAPDSVKPDHREHTGRPAGATRWPATTSPIPGASPTVQERTCGPGTGRATRPSPRRPRSAPPAPRTSCARCSPPPRAASASSAAGCPPAACSPSRRRATSSSTSATSAGSSSSATTTRPSAGRRRWARSTPA